MKPTTEPPTGACPVCGALTLVVKAKGTDGRVTLRKCSVKDCTGEMQS